MAMSKDVFCNIHETRNSTSWCFECEQMLCSECTENHTKIKVTRGHKLISVSEYSEIPEFIKSINTQCNVHERVLEFYCSTHAMTCCDYCMKETHDNCSSIQTLNCFVHQIKTSFAFKEIENRIAELVHDLENILKDRRENADQLKNQRISALDNITSIRKSLNDHLDKLESEILKKLSEKYKEHEEEFNDIIAKITKKQEDIKEFEENLKKTEKYATELQTFLFLQLTEAKMKGERTFLQSLIRQKKLENVSIHFTKSKTTSNITRKCKSFGEVTINKDPESIQIVSLEQAKAQILSQHKIDVDDISIKRIRNEKECMNIMTDYEIFPYMYCRKDELVITEKKGCEKHEFTVKLPSPGWSSVYIGSEEAAVTLFQEKKIAIINISNKCIIRIFKVCGHCHNLIFDKNQLILFIPGSEKIQMYDKHGLLLREVLLPVDSFHQLAVCGDEILCTDWGENQLLYCDLEGNIIRTFQPRLCNEVKAITIDKYGFIYVACVYSGTIYVISPDGKKNKLLHINQEKFWYSGPENSHGPDTMTTFTCKERDYLILDRNKIYKIAYS